MVPIPSNPQNKVATSSRSTAPNFGKVKFVKFAKQIQPPKKKCIPDTKASRIANTYFIHIFHRVGRRAAQLWADTRFSWSDLTRQPGLVAARTSSVGWHQGFQKKTLREFQPAFPSRLERTGDSLASPAVTTTTTNVYPKNPDPSLIDAGPIFGEGGTSPDFFPLVIIGA